MKTPLVELRQVSYSYNQHWALHHISLEIQGGEYVGLIGPNGGGKTTLL
ncbi:MAG: ATP-binding cassette domain-containing protein, partial [Deinococcus sp.]|nr:ATP-binding cassette domain-containing protein [Deinococcus sp.]